MQRSALVIGDMEQMRMSDKAITGCNRPGTAEVPIG